MTKKKRSDASSKKKTKPDLTSRVEDGFSGPTGKVRAFTELLSAGQRKWLLLILCVVAALRIFFFGAAFPFFNNVDEQYHFDLIWKYSQGQWPASGTDKLGEETLRNMFCFGSPEYLNRARDLPNGEFAPPLFSWPADVREKTLKKFMATSKPNIEEYSPPLYYLLAGKWLVLGKLMGLRDAGLLYWTRFLDVPLYVVLMITAYLLGRMLPYGDSAMAWGLPLLVAFMPQDVFYSLNSDVLTPIPSGIAFLLLVRIALGKNCHWLHYAALGLSISAALLTKLANIPLLAMAALLLIIHAVRNGRAWISKNSIADAFSFLTCLIVPVSLWVVRNHMKIGDWTGTSHKLGILGWQYKPISGLLPHPILSLSGLSYFLNNVFTTFWRGEFVWQLDPLGIGFVDSIYAISTIFLLLAAVFFLSRMRGASEEKTIVLISLAGIGAALGYLALLSMMFDFRGCFYPSAANPFFTSGRLILCVMFPVLFCFTWSMDRLAVRFTGSFRGIFFIAGMCVLMIISELYLVTVPLRSDYNFFHVPLGKPF